MARCFLQMLIERFPELKRLMTSVTRGERAMLLCARIKCQQSTAMQVLRKIFDPAPGDE